MKIPILLFGIGLLLGGMASRMTQPPLSSPSPPAASPRAISETPPNLEELRQMLLQADSDTLSLFRLNAESPYAPFLADWDLDEIRAALDAAAADPQLVLGGDETGLAASALLKEWLRRDLDGACAWFDAQTIPAVQRRLAIIMSMGWPPEESAAGLEFLLSHRSFFETTSPWAIIEKNIIASAERGASSLIHLLEHLQSEELPTDFMLRTDFPPGFDYPTLVQSESFNRLASDSMQLSILAEWLNADIGPAVAFLLEKNGVQGLADATRGLPFTIDPEKRNRLWSDLGPSIQSLPEDQQTAFFDQASSRLRSFPEAASAFANHLNDSPLADDAHALAAHALFRHDLTTALQHLDAIRDPAQRLRIMEEIPNRSAMMKSSPEQLQNLHDRLVDWGASPSEISNLLAPFSP
ncbi:hypothetical protein HNR46_001787 [Haloferula luteola]|uniref:Uncharacterized protein n=1 Tax=Haloferula luteola TaxID=595692 RepID=A0A840VCA2_9BACT|nr:hypothetical protein [Haloferula luteola]MBB5351550.1 hypothetical protein [Haloferula luteola]